MEKNVGARRYRFGPGGGFWGIGVPHLSILAVVAFRGKHVLSPRRIHRNFDSAEVNP